MSFKIIRNDITKVRADAIVNTASACPLVGSGTDMSVYEAAGFDALLAERRKIGDIPQGQSVWTKSFNLKKNGIKYIIHTVGTPYSDGKKGQVDILRSCYSSSLMLAKKLGCKSVALPLLATGNYGFPKEIGLKVAVEEISSFLLQNEIEVLLVVYDKESYLVSEKVFDDIQDFLDDNLEESLLSEPAESVEYTRHIVVASPVETVELYSLAHEEDIRQESLLGTHLLANKSRSDSLDVDAFISQSDDRMNFQNTLQKLIADRKLENSAVYTKALIDRKFFSKIISQRNYIPKKMTVMALGLALELKLDDFENFLASAGYAIMPSSKFDLIVKYCVMKGIYNLIEVDMILYSHNVSCFASK